MVDEKSSEVGVIKGAPLEERAMIETLLIATDGSRSVGRAVDVAVDIADRFDAAVHALYVVDSREIDASPAAIRTEFNAALEDLASEALASVTDRTNRGITTAVWEGDPAAEITAYARQHDVDVVAMGTRGRHGENRLLIGSVAEAVVRTCPVPVLTVRQLNG